jgi:dolichyl-phosphate-mannose-protein mannosyltransferase
MRLGLGIALWAVFAVWLAPALLSLAHRGALPFADLLLRSRGTIPLSAYLEQWRWSALWLTGLGGTAAVIAVERRWLQTPALSVAVLIGGAFLFHLAAIRDGMWYGSDAAFYLTHARSIVEGTPYSQTGYLVNPTLLHSPPTYPPLYPLMLAPIYAVAGLDVHAMKVLGVVAVAAATGGLYLLARRMLPVGPSLVAAWLFAFSPFVEWLKDDLASDIPFLAIVLVCLWLAEKAREAGGRTDAGWRLGAAVGLFCYAAVATRSVGVVLLPALLIADIVRVRRISRYNAALGGVAIGLIVLQEALLGNVRSYAGSTNWGDVGLMMRSTRLNARLFTGLLFGGLPGSVQVIAAAVAAAAAVAGTLQLIRRGWYATALFMAGYTVALVLWPAIAGPRVLLPLLAIGVILVFVALRQPEERRHWRTVAAATLVGLCAVSYALRYHETSRAPLPDDFARSEHTELVAFVDSATAPTDVFISMAPRTFAFLTRRTASIYDKRLSLEEQWRYFESIHAAYLVARKGVDEADAAYLARMISTYPDRFRLAFSNATYQVYHIVPAGAR